MMGERVLAEPAQHQAGHGHAQLRAEMKRVGLDLAR